MARDYSVIMGILVIGAILTMIGNLLADISYALVGPAHSNREELIVNPNADRYNAE